MLASSVGFGDFQPLDTTDQLFEAPATTDSQASIVVSINEAWPSNEDGLALQTNRSGPLIRRDAFRLDPRFAGIDGRGFSTVILDSGIDLDDPFFGPDANGDGISDRIIFTHDFTGGSSVSDVLGHGSNVSSIVASSDPTYTGVAPGADIIHLKVIGNNGTGSFSALEKALKWVILNADQYNIAAVNLSLGDGGNYSKNRAMFGVWDEFSALAAMDVIVVAAAGNSFFAYGSTQGVAYPAADANTIAVGAVFDSNIGTTWSYRGGAKAFTTGADHITPFTQRHATLVDVFAPGAAITGAGAGVPLTTQHGTSQAAPHVTGAAVLAQQLAAEHLGRRLALDEFRDLLQDNSVTIHDGDDENDNVVNTGLDFARIDLVSLGNGILDLAGQPEILVTQGRRNVLDGLGRIDFGNTVDGFPVTKTLTIVNQGPGVLTLDSNSFILPTGFSVATGFGESELAANHTTTFDVTLDAISAGSFGGNLSFINNDFDEGNYNFTLSGTVKAVKIVEAVHSRPSDPLVYYPGLPQRTASPPDLQHATRVGVYTGRPWTSGNHNIIKTHVLSIPPSVTDQINGTLDSLLDIPGGMTTITGEPLLVQQADSSNPNGVLANLATGV